MDFSTLMYDEPVRLDPEPLGALHRELGPAGAENVVSRALDELTQRMIEVRQHFDAGRLPEMGRLARSLVAIGSQMGMTRFAKVAADVALCANSGDHAALCATFSRLERLADGSLMAMWDLQDMRV